MTEQEKWSSKTLWSLLLQGLSRCSVKDVCMRACMCACMRACISQCMLVLVYDHDVWRAALCVCDLTCVHEWVCHLRICACVWLCTCVPAAMHAHGPTTYRCVCSEHAPVSFGCPCSRLPYLSVVHCLGCVVDPAIIAKLLCIGSNGMLWQWALICTVLHAPHFQHAWCLKGTSQCSIFCDKQFQYDLTSMHCLAAVVLYVTPSGYPLQADYRMTGNEELICCSVEGEGVLSWLTCKHGMCMAQRAASLELPWFK